MKKKYRDITVDDIKYGYTVRGDGGKTLTVYKDNTLIFCLYQSRSVWLSGEITPLIVADEIRKHINNPSTEVLV